MRYGCGAILSITALALAGCQGGGSSFTPNSTGTALPTQITQSQSITPAGGSVSATLGVQTVTVKVPAGAVASTATFSLTVYANSAIPKTLAANAKQTLAKRATRSVSSDAILISSFSLSDGGVPLLKPLQASLTTANAASGSVFRLAGYGTNAFGDVDTVTWSSNLATEDDNVKYAGITLAANTLYAFYVTALPQAAPTFTLVMTGPTTVGTLTTGSYTGVDTDGNGFPILPAGTVTFTVDNPGIGTINASTGVLTAGPSDGTGNVVATDAARGLTGKLAVSVNGSVRPAGSGDTFTYTGTMTTVLTDNLAPVPGGTPAPVTSTTTAKVNQTVASTGTTDGVNYTLNTDEVDHASLTDLETKTQTQLAYKSTGANAYVVRTVKSASVEPATQVSYETDYGANNGALTAIPEAVGTTLTNDAQSTYTETDPGNPGYDNLGNPTQPTIVRVSDPLNQYQMEIWTNGFPGFYQQSSSGLGIAQVLLNATPIEYDLEPVAPDASSPYPVKYDVVENIYELNNNFQKIASLGTAKNYPWYGTSVPSTLFSDTVTITPQSSLDASCTPFGTATSATLVKETYTSLDTALGQTETRTIKSYDQAGPGTVCIVLSDTVNTFYDFSGQEGATILKRPLSPTPYETDSVTESLSLAGTTAQSAGRSTQSTSTGLRLPVAGALRARFDHVAAQVRQKQANRLSALSRTLRGKL